MSKIRVNYNLENDTGNTGEFFLESEGNYSCYPDNFDDYEDALGDIDQDAHNEEIRLDISGSDDTVFLDIRNSFEVDSVDEALAAAHKVLQSAEKHLQPWKIQ